MPAVAEVDRRLRAWGCTFKANGRAHRTLQHSTGWTVNLPRKGQVNIDTMREIANRFGVSIEDFLAGPPEPAPAKNGSAVSGNGSVEITTAKPPDPPAAKPKPPRIGHRMTGSRAKVVRYLHELGGEMVDPSGKCVKKTAEAVGMTPGALTQLIGKGLEPDGIVLRDKMKGGKESLRQVYRLLLVQDHPDVVATVGAPVDATVVVAPPPPPPAAEEPEPEPQPPEPAPPLEVHLADDDVQRVAGAVLDLLVRRLTVQSREGLLRQQIDDLKGRLARQLEYSETLRRDLTAAKDELEDTRRPRVRR